MVPHVELVLSRLLSLQSKLSTASFSGLVASNTGERGAPLSPAIGIILSAWSASTLMTVL